MNKYPNFHEKELVELKSHTPLPRKSLHEFLISSGFKSEDDFYFIDRIDEAEPWQAISVLNLEVFLGEEAIYETKVDIKETGGGVWDRLDASYPLASLPGSYIEDFCNKIFLLANRFKLAVYHQNDEVDKMELLNIFKVYAKNLVENYSEPGSEVLGILIQDTYPR